MGDSPAASEVFKFCAEKSKQPIKMFEAFAMSLLYEPGDTVDMLPGSESKDTFTTNQLHSQNALRSLDHLELTLMTPLSLCSAVDPHRIPLIFF